MRMCTPRPILLGLVLVFAALLGALPAHPARAQVEPDPKMRPWAITADFSGNAPSITVTEYEVTLPPNSPPIITAWTTTDISDDCVEVGSGSITYQNGFAAFDGSTFLRCALPPLVVNTLDCDDEAPPLFYFAADVQLKNLSLTNPLLSAPDGSFSFGMPGNGLQARTKVQLQGVGYQSTTFPRSALWNEVLTGQGSEVITAIADTPGLELLDFLTPTWPTYFANLDPFEVGQWATWPGGAKTWTPGASVPPFVTPAPGFVDIGHSNGTILNGKIAFVEGDPCGCTVQ